MKLFERQATVNNYISLIKPYVDRGTLGMYSTGVTDVEYDVFLDEIKKGMQSSVDSLVAYLNLTERNDNMETLPVDDNGYISEGGSETTQETLSNDSGSELIDDSVSAYARNRWTIANYLSAATTCYFNEIEFYDSQALCQANASLAAHLLNEVNKAAAKVQDGDDLNVFIARLLEPNFKRFYSQLMRHESMAEKGAYLLSSLVLVDLALYLEHDEILVSAMEAVVQTPEPRYPARIGLWQPPVETDDSDPKMVLRENLAARHNR